MEPEEIVAEWLHGRPLPTQKAYLSDIQGLLIHLNCKPLESLTLRDLQRWQDRLIEEHHTPATIARKTSAVRGLFRHAAKQGHIPRDVALDLRSPPVDWDWHQKAVDRPTMLAIIAAAKPGRDRALIRLLYCTAARISEICNLWWQDFTPTAEGGAEVRVLGKRHRFRDLPVPPPVWAEVAALRGDAPGNASVFGLTRQSAGRIVKAAALAAGAPEWFSPHKIRHSTATQVWEAGAPLDAIQRLLGHSRPEMTLRYARSTQEKSAIDYLSWDVNVNVNDSDSPPCQ